MPLGRQGMSFEDPNAKAYEERRAIVAERRFQDERLKAQRAEAKAREARADVLDNAREAEEEAKQVCPSKASYTHVAQCHPLLLL